VVRGGYGVSFFFVLSGFILAYVYWDDFQGGVTRPAYRRYAVARFARIYPAYVLGLLLITFLYDFINWKMARGVRLSAEPVTSWLMNLFALQTFSLSYATQQVWNGPAWSISTEFGFYILCPSSSRSPRSTCAASGGWRRCSP
jgi:peptidoglycan/LPS O-acetylase OafA/YrhL